MREELDEKLCHDFPDLFRDRHGAVDKTCMCRGFECGDGWYELIDTVSALLVDHNPKIRARQVKEKLAGLRFYHTHPDDYTDGVINMADAVSFYTCEICGAPGRKVDQGGWLCIRCELHQRSDNGGSLKVARINEQAPGWLGLITTLQELAQWQSDKNGIPAAVLSITPENDHLGIEYSGVNATIQGMVDFVSRYSNKLDRYTGCIRLQ